MRTTLSIPDPYYQKVKKALPELGYQTVNEMLLDLIRHHFDAGNGIKQGKPHQIDATPQVKIDKKPVKVEKPADVADFCKHGYLKSMCKFEKCKK